MSKDSSVPSRLVLLVEDHDDTRAMMRMSLELSGFLVADARDAETALAWVSKCAPDVITVDVGLPGMSGLELARLLRQHAPTREVPLVAITGWASTHDLERAKHAGCDVVLTKPCPPDMLVAEIRRLVGQRSEPTAMQSRDGATV
jgi:two-component system, cell cycle response regulator DivK